MLHGAGEIENGTLRSQNDPATPSITCSTSRLRLMFPRCICFSTSNPSENGFQNPAIACYTNEMGYTTKLAVFLICAIVRITVADGVPGAVNYAVLENCKHSSDCHPWQTCATCTKASNRDGAQVVRYCSDFNFRGLCGYRDKELSCSCSETINDRHRAYMSGTCESDYSCHLQSLPTESRCAICLNKSPGPFDQDSYVMCTPSPADNPLSFCAKKNQHQCSCGQVYPILDRQPGIWDEQQQGMLDQNQFNAVAAPPDSFAQSSISSDQVADQQGSNNLQQSWSQDNNGGQHDSLSNPEQLGIQENGVQYGFPEGNDQYGFFT